MPAVAKEKMLDVEYPDLGHDPIPVDPYISQSYFEKERDAVFRKSWLHVGRVEEIPDSGDYFTKEIPIGNTCLLIVRGADGVVRGFHNMCSHRGNRLAYDASGNAKNFVCEFHGWTFGREGELLGVPGADRFDNLDFATLGLTPVATDVWQGFIFVNLDPAPRWTLDEFLGDLGAGMDGVPFDRLSEACYAWKAEMVCNWKLVRDAFSEAYHVMFVHRRSVAKVAADRGNPLSYPLAINLVGLHRVLSVYSNPGYDPTPAIAAANRHGPSMTRYVREAGDAWTPSWPGTTKTPSGVNPARSPNWNFDLQQVFPNFNIHVHDTNTYLTWQFWPISVDRCIFEARWYFPKPNNAGERFAQEYTKVLAVDTAKEDLSTCERVQEMLNSGAKTEFPLADHEVCIRHNNQIIDDFIDAHRAE